MAAPERKNKHYLADSDTHGFMSSTDKTKLDFLTLTGSASLDTINTKVGYLTVTGATNLDTINTKAGYITVTQAVDLDTMESAISTLQTEMNAVQDVLVTPVIALSASATTDGMDITIQFNDKDGTKIASVILFELWISEAATGIGLTADTASGDFTASTGSEHEELTSKKHYRLLTDASGDFVATLVDSANPVDQYVVIPSPTSGVLTVSAASGTSWEGV